MNKMEIRTGRRIQFQCQNSSRLWDKKWVNLYELMCKLEEHKFCNEYHKIQSPDDKTKYYKESCLFIIHKELKEGVKHAISISKDEIKECEILLTKILGGKY